MTKARKIFFVICPFLIVVACSSNDWSYRYEGHSGNWSVVAEMIPDKENGARFIGKIKHLTDKKVKLIQYEADVTKTSQHQGKIENPIFHDGYLHIFQDVPNTESAKQEFKNGVTDEEVKQFFGEYPVYEITWIEEQGEEHSETIQLKFVEPNY